MQKGRFKKKKTILEATNLREETNFTEYYDNLDAESLLDVDVIDGSSSDEPQVVRTNGLMKRDGTDGDGLQEGGETDIAEYMNKRHEEDLKILERLKRPSFRLLGGSTDANGLSVPDRRYVKLGYHIHSEHSRREETYTRSREWSYGLVKGCLRYADAFQVLYDMDEQDMMFVDHLNRLRAENELDQVTPELFESAITFLEMQNFFVEQLLPAAAKDETTLYERQILGASMYGSDDGKGVSPEEDQCCAVCNSNACDSSNAIVFCDGCNIAVHQECYGIAFIPEGPWLCRRCLISRNQDQRCLFCPSTTGAFKQTDNGYWAHVICALWINELYFANPIYMEPIEGVQNVPKSRWKLTCYICKRRVGACIQCCRNSCFAAYHVTCARRAELYLGLKKGIKGAIENQATLVSYCDKHTPREWALSHDTQLGIEKTRLYYSTGNAKRAADEANRVAITPEKKTELTTSKSHYFRWKTAGSAPVVPLIFAKRLQEFLKSERIDIKNSFDFIIQVSKYWSLKREANKAPLIKRPDPTNFSSLTDEQVQERFEVLKYIKDDVLKLEDISESAAKRSEISSLLNDEIINEAELLYFPEIYAVDSLGKALLKSDKTNVLGRITAEAGIRNGLDIIENIENHRYKTVQSLIDDIESLTNYTIGATGKNSAAYRFLKLGWGKVKRRHYSEALELETMAQNGNAERPCSDFDNNNPVTMEDQNQMSKVKPKKAKITPSHRIRPRGAASIPIGKRLRQQAENTPIARRLRG
ncbi:DEKNAAC101104 [Brettanomyces naardenensis]|uniref:DEKNAAC101104 n=1 Tax=Brettanomyces naardenensis TaxID=13370 RepID=A0A448YHE2_BRENA|nr:DEKNAAC101104 [Brettanomyces naardenensis]